MASALQPEFVQHRLPIADRSDIEILDNPGLDHSENATIKSKRSTAIGLPTLSPPQAELVEEQRAKFVLVCHVPDPHFFDPLIFSALSPHLDQGHYRQLGHQKPQGRRRFQSIHR